MVAVSLPLPRSSCDEETWFVGTKIQKRRFWVPGEEAGQEELFFVEGRSLLFEMMSDIALVVVVVVGRWVAPGNNCAFEDGFGALEVLDMGKTVTQVVLVTVNCLRSLSGHLGQWQKHLQHQYLNTTEVAGWMTKESHLDTKVKRKINHKNPFIYVKC